METSMISVTIFQLVKARSSISGPSFCQVRRRKVMVQLRLDITGGNQDCMGAIPILSRILNSITHVELVINEAIIKVEPMLWVMKYLIMASGWVKVIREIYDIMLISIAIHNRSQLDDDMMTMFERMRMR